MYTSGSARDADELDTDRLPVEATQIMTWYIDQWSGEVLLAKQFVLCFLT